MMLANRSGMELLARCGYAARGAVSLIIGILALLAAFGRGGGATGSKGALQTILFQPLGGVLLVAVALGLCGFAVWRAVQSILDADGLGAAPKGMAVRAGQAISAVVYAGLGVFAVSLVVGWNYGVGDEEQSARDWTRWLLARPFGQWMVGIVGLAVAGAGLGMAHKAWTASFARHLACDHDTLRWIVPLGRAGYAARCVVFLIIGAFLVVAAYQSDSGEARGLSGALLALQEQPFGRVLFGVVALGLAAFGAFGFVEGRYRRIAAPSIEEIGKVVRKGIP
jgi:succinate dehydrogenase hydrophobic anchor subunit